GHDLGRLTRAHDKQIHGQGGGEIHRIEAALTARKIESAEGLMDEQGPAAGANKPGDGGATAMSAQAISALSVAHLIFDTPSIELRPTFTKAEYRSVAQSKSH